MLSFHKLIMTSAIFFTYRDPKFGDHFCTVEHIFFNTDIHGVSLNNI